MKLTTQQLLNSSDEELAKELLEKVFLDKRKVACIEGDIYKQNNLKEFQSIDINSWGDMGPLIEKYKVQVGYESPELGFKDGAIARVFGTSNYVVAGGNILRASAIAILMTEL